MKTRLILVLSLAALVLGGLVTTLAATASGGTVIQQEPVLVEPTTVQPTTVQPDPRCLDCACEAVIVPVEPTGTQRLAVALRAQTILKQGVCRNGRPFGMGDAKEITRTGMGTYVLDFGRDVTNCTIEVTIAAEDPDRAGSRGGGVPHKSVVPTRPNSEVLVVIRDFSGANVDRAFDVKLTCP